MQNLFMHGSILTALLSVTAESIQIADHVLPLMCFSPPTRLQSSSKTRHLGWRCACTHCLRDYQGYRRDHYWVIVYRKPYTMLPIDTMFYIGATEFTIGAAIPSFAAQSFQSACTGSDTGDVDKVELLLPGTFTLY